MSITAAASTAPSPLLPESSSSESVGVETVMNDMRDGIVTIPDYQRDGDQWDDASKSVFVESVINNLTIPALFFETKLGGDGVERSEVVDGQQRLTTLKAFYDEKLELVDSKDAPYLSPNSVHYAGKTFKLLPFAYQQAFKKYRLTVIKLRQLGDMKLEVFRRINQGGTPLSAQDIRLAYFGDESATISFIRLVGIYDKQSSAGKRFTESALRKHNLRFPWSDNRAFGTWNDWWAEKEISRGQTASEMFLWALLSAEVVKMDTLLANKGALEGLKCRYTGTVSEALDAYCARVQYEDRKPDVPKFLISLEELNSKFFPHFQSWIDFLLGRVGVSLPVTKHRVVACVIGAAYRDEVSPQSLTGSQSTEVVEFIRSPRDAAKKFQVLWPESKGRWDGPRGYSAQLKAAHEILSRLRS